MRCLHRMNTLVGLLSVVCLPVSCIEAAASELCKCNIWWLLSYSITSASCRFFPSSVVARHFRVLKQVTLVSPSTRLRLRHVTNYCRKLENIMLRVTSSGIMFFPSYVKIGHLVQTARSC
jgi:hypothetical protein